MTVPAPPPGLVRRLRAAGCVFAEEEARLLVEASAGADLEALVARRVAGEPLEQVLGWAEFCGRRYRVEPGVFVPRQRTRLMVDEAVRRLAGVRHPVVVDLCCGNGAIGLAIADRVDGVELHAADIDPAAVRCAQQNVGTRGRVYRGDLDAPLPDDLRARVDVLAANVPYVPTGEIVSMPPEARDHEKRVALDGGTDGLAVTARVAAAAPRWLRAGGSVLTETSRRQAEQAASIFDRHGLDAAVVIDEELAATVVVATRPGRRGAATSLLS